MPLCASDNRAKSWSCEHCPDWVRRDRQMCETCLWAVPENYRHVAGRAERRLTIVLRDEETQVYDEIATLAAEAGLSPDQWVARRLDRLVFNADA